MSDAAKAKSIPHEVFFLIAFIFCLLLATAGLHRLGLLDKINSLSPNYYNNTNTVNPNYSNSTNTGTIATNTNSAGRNHYTLEQELRNASIQYVERVYNNNLGLDTLIVKVSVLEKNGYLYNFKDDKGKKCSGYAEVLLDGSNNIIYKPYIKCGKYKTNGYLERKDS